jgi:multiple sugar transport system permease protein
MAFPLYWAVVVSLRPTELLFELPPKFLPNGFYWQSYLIAWKQASFGQYFLNTVIYAVLGTFLAVLLCSLSGYIFAKIRFRAKNILFFMILMLLMIPYSVVLIPQFLIVKKFPLAGGNSLFGQGGTGLIDTYAGLLLPGLVSAYFIFMFRQFMSLLPDELIAAARIDGASERKIFFRVIAPLAKPAFATVGLFYFLRKWNDLLWPLVATTRPGMRTLQVGLAIFQGEQRTAADWNFMMAAAVISIAPIIVVFLLAQKHFTQGIALTGLKQ